MGCSMPRVDLKGRMDAERRCITHLSALTNPAPCALCPAPCALYPAPCVLHPAGQKLCEIPKPCCFGPAVSLTLKPLLCSKILYSFPRARQNLFPWTVSQAFPGEIIRSWGAGEGLWCAVQASCTLITVRMIKAQYWVRLVKCLLLGRIINIFKLIMKIWVDASGHPQQEPYSPPSRHVSPWKLKAVCRGHLSTHCSANFPH